MLGCACRTRYLSRKELILLQRASAMWTVSGERCIHDIVSCNVYMTPKRNLPGRCKADLPSPPTPWSCIFNTYCCYLIKHVAGDPMQHYLLIFCITKTKHSKEGHSKWLECKPTS